MAVCCALAEGTAEIVTSTPDAAAVAAVLRDPLQRTLALHGREGMRRSFASVIAALVARFLSLTSVEGRRVISESCHPLDAGVATSMAVSSDASVAVFVASGKVVRLDPALKVQASVDVCDLETLGSANGAGAGFLLCKCPRLMGGLDIVLLNQSLQNVCTINLARIPRTSVAACVDARRNLVIVAGYWTVFGGDTVTISEFNTRHGSYVRNFRTSGRQLYNPICICALPNSDLAIADIVGTGVAVFSPDGTFLRSIGAAYEPMPSCIACSSSGELFVARSRVYVFDVVDGTLLATLEESPLMGNYSALALHETRNKTLLYTLSQSSKPEPATRTILFVFA